MWFILSLLGFFLFVHTYGQHSNPCKDVLGQRFKPDEYDCRKYHFCSPTKDWILNCEHSRVWNQELQTCVVKGSDNDTCSSHNSFRKSIILPYYVRQQLEVLTKKKAVHYKKSEEATSPFMISPVDRNHPTIHCPANSSMRFAHPSRCAQYYDCASNPADDWWGLHLKECRYPQLFNDVTEQCDHHTNVNCGERLVPKDPCDYVQNICRTGNCVPCNIRFPACSGMKNGLNKWRGRDNSPYFTLCVDERMLLTSRCQATRPGRFLNFSQETRLCAAA